MKTNEYITPTIEVVEPSDTDILTASSETFFFLPMDEFREL